MGLTALLGALSLAGSRGNEDWAGGADRETADLGAAGAFWAVVYLEGEPKEGVDRLTEGARLGAAIRGAGADRLGADIRAGADDRLGADIRGADARLGADIRGADALLGADIRGAEADRLGAERIAPPDRPPPPPLPPRWAKAVPPVAKITTIVATTIQQEKPHLFAHMAWPLSGLRVQPPTCWTMGNQEG